MIKIRAGYEIIYDSPQPAPKVFLLNVHPSRARDLVTPDVMRFDPQVPSSQYVDGFGYGSAVYGSVDVGQDREAGAVADRAENAAALNQAGTAKALD